MQLKPAVIYLQAVHKTPLKLEGDTCNCCKREQESVLRCETLHTVQTGHRIKDGYRCQKVLYGTLQGKSAT